MKLEENNEEIESENEKWRSASRRSATRDAPEEGTEVFDGENENEHV